MDAGQPATARWARPASSAVTDVRVRWRSSASEPVSTVLPLRMMLTRSHSASTSLRMWLESRTVRPAVALLGHALAGRPPPSAGRARRSARPGSAGRRRRRRRRPGRPSGGCPWSRYGPSWSGPARTARAARRAPGLVEAAAQPAVQVDDLAAGEVAPQGDVSGDVRDAAVQLDRVAPGVPAEQLGGAGVGAQQSEQDADGGGLPGAVGAEEAVDLTGLDVEVEAVQRVGPAEGLVQAGRR